MLIDAVTVNAVTLIPLEISTTTICRMDFGVLVIPEITVPASTVPVLAIPEFSECPYSAPEPPPPVYSKYASSIYPLYQVDGFKTEVAIVYANAVPVPYPVDSITTGLLITGGSYPTEVRYLTAETGVDNLQTSLSIVAGSYPNEYRYLDYTIPAEDALVTQLVLLSGSVVNYRYLDLQIPEEYIQTSLMITGGELTNA